MTRRLLASAAAQSRARKAVDAQDAAAEGGTRASGVAGAQGHESPGQGEETGGPGPGEGAETCSSPLLDGDPMPSHDAWPSELLYQSNFVLVQSAAERAEEQTSMRLVTYTRLSQVNAHEGESHEAQRERIEAWALDAGHVVVSHSQDTVSGENGAEDRPGFLEALTTLEDGDADGLVVSSIDRLARKLATQEALLTTVWRRGGRVYEVGMGEVPQDDPNDPYRTFVRQVMGAAAQLERALIVKRMGDGRRSAIRRGRLIGPAPSFGWVRDPDDRGRVLPDPATFGVVETAVERRANGETLRQVATWLAEQTGRDWSATQVKRVLDRHERYSRATA